MSNKYKPTPLIKTFPIGRRVRSPYSDIVKIKTENNGLGILKSFIIFGIIALQAILFVFLQLRFVLVFRWTLGISFLISLITCIYVLSSKKNGHSKAVWIIFLLIFFTFGYIFYLISDERIFFRRAGKRYKNIYKETDKYKEEIGAYSKNEFVNRDCQYLSKVGNFSAFSNSTAKYFSSGASFFDDLLERLEQAQEFVFMEFFIVSDGVLFDRIFDVLKRKAESGVQIRLIYDDMGCHKSFSQKCKWKLKKAGIQILAFNKLVPIFSIVLNYRDHRKMVVIDGKTAYSGGCNLADEYVNERRLHGYWKDAGIRIDGRATDGFTLMFLRQWEFLSKKQEDYSKYLKKADEIGDCGIIVPYADGLDYPLPIGENVYENMFASATKKIYIMTPYFIVDEPIIDLLENKALSGVDVRIILPEVPDKAFVYGVTRNYAEKLIDYGVKVYTMKNSFVHSKVVLTENSAVVGSINMDLRSFYQQFECAVYTDDKTIMEQINKDFEESISESVLITEKNKLRNSVLYRLFGGMMQIFAPFM